MKVAVIGSRSLYVTTLKDTSPQKRRRSFPAVLSVWTEARGNTHSKTVLNLRSSCRIMKLTANMRR